VHPEITERGEFFQSRFADVEWREESFLKIEAASAQKI
jgi:hypothetical protein